MFDADISLKADQLVKAATLRHLWLTTAESCTGGLLGGALTSVSGASSVVGAGFITYSNEAKQSLLGVSSPVLARFGAVSSEVAREMAVGALKAAEADLALAVTGIAGPTGGSAEKPVGLVFIAGALGAGVEVQRHDFGALGRDAVRRESVLAALSLGLGLLKA